MIKKIGEGGMAVVYVARDTRHDRQVAIKVLNPELAETIGAERFLLEIETAANLTHPHILPLHDSGDIDGHLFYVMPYVDGESLRDRLDRETQLPVDDAIRITQEVADGLNYAHSQGVIHRDIKPENILLSDGHALIADFGIARAVSVAGGARLTEIGSGTGPVTILSDSPTWLWPSSWSPDGRWIAFTWPQTDRQLDIYAIQVNSPGNVHPVTVTTSASESSARFSPNGHWLSYQSDETGQEEIYVVSFPEIGSKRQISSGGGRDAQWSRAGDRLYFRQGVRLMVARVAMTDEEFRFEPARPLFEFTESTYSYSVAPDGQRFLTKIRNPDTAAEEIHVVLNWFEVVKEIAGR